MSRRLRRLFVTLAALATVAVVAYLGARRFAPDWFDRERVNAAELAALGSAPLRELERGTAWPQWLGPTRDGRAPAGPLRTDWAARPPQVAWSVPCGGGHSSFAAVDGKLYTQDYANGQERLLCLDAGTGASLWAMPYAVDYSDIDRNFANGPRATPSLADGRAFVVSADGQLLAIDPPTPSNAAPSIAWRKDLLKEFGAELPTWGVSRSPLVDGDLVLVQPGAKRAMLAAYDRRTGELRWSGGSDAAGYSSPTLATVGGVRQVVAVGGSKLVGVRADDGRELWSAPWATAYNGNIATPLVVDDYVFVSSAYSKGCGLFRVVPAGDKFTAETVYFRSKRVMQNHHANCVARGGYLYGFDGDALRCVDLRKGEAVPDWESRDGANKPLGKGNLILANDSLIGLTQTGTLFLADADPTEFRPRGEIPGALTGPRSWALPVLVDGRLYLRDDTKIVAYDVK